MTCVGSTSPLQWGHDEGVVENVVVATVVGGVCMRSFNGATTKESWKTATAADLSRRR